MSHPVPMLFPILLPARFFFSLLMINGKNRRISPMTPQNKQTNPNVDLCLTVKWPKIRSWSTAFLCHTSSLVNDGRVGCPRATSSMSGVITVISGSYRLFLLISVWWPGRRRDSVTSGVWEGVNLHHLANVLITDLHCPSSVVLMKSLGQPYAWSTWFEGWAGTLWMQMRLFFFWVTDSPSCPEHPPSHSSL